MAEFTPNFNLKKPNEYEFYNIDDFNENMDIIDQKLKEASQNEQLQSDVTEIKGTTEDIKTSIGSAEDLSSSPTIFGKLAEIKEILTTKFADIISKITGIDSKIGTTTDTGGTSSAGGIFAKLNKLLTDWTTTRASRIDSIYSYTQTSTTSSSTGTLSQKLNYIRTLIGASSDSGTTTLFGLLKGLSSKGIVKSVQRGVTANTSITISSVVPNKCIVLLNNEVVGFGLTATGNNEDYVYGAYMSSLSETKLTITNNRTTYKGTTHNVSWQVIEFY